MKTVKVLFAAACMLLTAAFMNAAYANGNNNNAAVEEEEVCAEVPGATSEEEAGRCMGSVTNGQVIEYLGQYGYDVYQIFCDGTCNRIADTQFEYNTYVFTNCAIITGHENM